MGAHPDACLLTVVARRLGAATRVPAAMASAARAVLRAAEEVKERLDEMKGDHSSEGGGDDGIADVFSESGVASRARHAVASAHVTSRHVTPPYAFLLVRAASQPLLAAAVVAPVARLLRAVTLRSADSPRAAV